MSKRRSLKAPAVDAQAIATASSSPTPASLPKKLPPVQVKKKAPSQTQSSRPKALYTAQVKPQCTYSLQRGDVVWIKASREVSTPGQIWPDRPALILSDTEYNETLDTVVVAYVTHSASLAKAANATSKRYKNMPLLSYPIVFEDQESFILANQIDTVSISRVGAYVYTLPSQLLSDISTTVNCYLNLPPYKEERMRLKSKIVQLANHNPKILAWNFQRAQDAENATIHAFLREELVHARRDIEILQHTIAQQNERIRVLQLKAQGIEL